VRVLKVAHALLKDGGVALVQVRYDDLTPFYRPKRRDYRENAIQSSSYRIDEFWRFSEESGFLPLFLSLEPKVNYAYFFMCKRQPAGI